MKSLLLHNASIVNENRQYIGWVGINDKYIENIGEGDVTKDILSAYNCVIDLNGDYLFPGVIDDQVHFREPGLTHKADIASESRAAIAGGVTSFMDMPNTKPQTITKADFEWKLQRASETSMANFGFFFGATNDNINEINSIDSDNIPGIKLFLGASTGNMLVDNENTLDEIFKLNNIVAIHSEDEEIIRRNMTACKEKYGENIPISCHPLIRNEEACYRSTLRAVERAKKWGTRLHVLHLSTAKELELFTSEKLSSSKHITSEVCVHHLWFADSDYERLGTKIKWNPAIKSISDREALREAVRNGKIDIVATDHAPHLWSEKEGDCSHAASGGPMVQHSLILMLELANQGVFTVEKVIETMCHNPAKLFGISKRGYIRKGYYADLAIVQRNSPWTVTADNILSKCGWSPLEGATFSHSVVMTIVNGHIAYHAGKFLDFKPGEMLKFNH